MAHKPIRHDGHRRSEQTVTPDASKSSDSALRAPASRGLAEVATALRTYVERAPHPVALIDDQRIAVHYANPAFHGLGGTAAELILGREAADVVLSAGATTIATLLRRVSETGEPVGEVNVDAVDTARMIAPWAVSIWPVASRGRRSGFLMLQVRILTGQVRARRRRTDVADEMREINERLLVASLREAELRDKAEAANDAKSVFLATMSHELRTPLAAIIGYQDLLAGAITGPITEAQRVQSARIKQSAGHLLALLDQVLTLACVEVDRETGDRRSVNVSALIESVVALIVPVAAAKGLTLAVDPLRCQLTLDTDFLKARQILLNVLGNAVKFSEHGTVRMTVRANGGYAEFEVRDSGIGIAPQHLDRVFDAFWQVQQGSTRTIGGSGLGLSVARRLSRLLDGDVTVTSSVGVGSIFTLRLPLYQPPRADISGSALPK